MTDLYAIGYIHAPTKVLGREECKPNGGPMAKRDSSDPRYEGEEELYQTMGKFFWYIVYGAATEEFYSDRFKPPLLKKPLKTHVKSKVTITVEVDVPSSEIGEIGPEHHIACGRVSGLTVTAEKSDGTGDSKTADPSVFFPSGNEFLRTETTSTACIDRDCGRLDETGASILGCVDPYGRGP